jgi:hypothetical protein
MLRIHRRLYAYFVYGPGYAYYTSLWLGERRVRGARHPRL